MDRTTRWETEALREARRGSGSRPRVSQRSTTDAEAAPGSQRDREPPPANDEWVTLREAEGLTGIPVGTLRKWARRETVSSRLESEGDLVLRLVSLPDVRRRAAELGRDLDPDLRRGPGPASPKAAEIPTETADPPDTMIVPVDAWNKMINQLGNLHEAGRELAEARERAAKAETEARFLRERLAEMRETKITESPAGSVTAPIAEQSETMAADAPTPTERRWRHLPRRLWKGRG